jgi:hypothetical protein
MRPASRPTPAMTLDVRRGPLEVLIEGLVQGSPAEQAASARRIYSGCARRGCVGLGVQVLGVGFWVLELRVQWSVHCFRVRRQVNRDNG